MSRYESCAASPVLNMLTTAYANCQIKCIQFSFIYKFSTVRVVPCFAPERAVSQSYSTRHDVNFVAFVICGNVIRFLAPCVSLPHLLVQHLQSCGVHFAVEQGTFRSGFPHPGSYHFQAATTICYEIKIRIETPLFIPKMIVNFTLRNK